MKLFKWTIIIISLITVHATKPMANTESATSESRSKPRTFLDFPKPEMEQICRNLALKDILSLRLACKSLQNVWNHEIILRFSAWKITKLFCCSLNDGLRILSEKLKQHKYNNPIEFDFHGCNLRELPTELNSFKHNLVRLNLASNHLSFNALVNLSNFSKLEYLNLNKNELTDLPPELAKLTKLKELQLRGNKELNEDAITNIVCNLSNLRNLDLSDCELNDLPGEMYKLEHLEELRLQNSHLPKTAIAKLSRCLPSLEFLDLDYNRITEIPAEISCLTHLRDLSLSYNAISTGIQNLCALQELKSLYLWHNNITELPTAIYKMHNLRCLHIDKNPLPKTALLELISMPFLLQLHYSWTNPENNKRYVTRRTRKYWHLYKPWRVTIDTREETEI